MKILVITSILLIIPGFLFSDHFFLKGHSSLTNTKVNIIHKIPIKRPVRELRVKLYKFYNFTNGMNKQIVSTYEPRITPKPELVESFVDDLGNMGLEIQFKDVQSDILIETSFIFDNEVELYPLTRFYGYPLNASSIRHVSQYLEGTALAPIDSVPLKKQVKKLVSRSRNVFQATMKIISWTQNNIELSPDVTYDEAIQTFQQAKGNRNGILNLTLSMLRIARIPCRLVHGLSINSSYLFLSKKRPRGPKSPGTVGGHVLYLPNQSKANIEIRYPKSLYKWIEVYFPDRDWVPFDPQTSFLFIPPNLLRRNVSLDSGDGLSHGIRLPKKYKVIFQYYIELSKERSRLSVEKHIHGGSGQFLYPGLKYRDRTFVQTLFRRSNQKGHYEYILRDKEIRIEFRPYTLDFTENREQLELKVSPGFYYSQRIHIKKPFYLKEIKLPLFRFNNDPKGKIWVEVYKGLKDRQAPGKLIAKSKLLQIDQLDNAGKYVWISFPFASDRDLFLTQGSIWVILKYESSEVILWRGIYANPFQDVKDTYYIRQKNPGKPSFIYLDLCIQVIGEPIK
ncbi:MAG: hypothetical protein IEMM0008_0325 [bacterium]|nr:MAG: hypothetical protein IEMM0008_0325 [bacterium]